MTENPQGREPGWKMAGSKVTNTEAPGQTPKEAARPPLGPKGEIFNGVRADAIAALAAKRSRTVDLRNV